MEAGIIGLGKFGMQLGKSLTEMGHTCAGIDIDYARVQQAREIMSHVYEADVLISIPLPSSRCIRSMLWPSQ